MGKFRLITEKKSLPNGRTKTMRLIDHPGAVLIMPVVDKNHVVLLKQYRPALGSYLWEFPCGTLEADERTLTCARRELAEEAGYGAKNWKKLGAVWVAPGYTNEKVHLYQASHLFARSATQDEDEVIRVHVCSRREIREMISRQRLTDAKSLCVLTLSGWLA